MLAIAVLFFLVVWVFITLFAMHIGSKILKKRMSKSYAGKLGGFLGFMLTMGGFMVYWTVEYIQIQRTVTHLCETEGGITVYVTPEEWRQQIGEEEWAKLVPYSSSQQHDFEKHHRVLKKKKYYSVVKYNRRIILYSHTIPISKYITGDNSIIFDGKNNNILLEKTYFSAGVGAWLAGGSYKLWLNNIGSCSNSTNEKFYRLIKLYSNDSIGEN